ncbi:MAG TPA: hypothetical protein VFP94_04460 [Terriglobales bacterium]|nr:hypothetical protein [Terriglobales bacterium]
MADYERRQPVPPAALVPAPAARQLRLEMNLRLQAIHAYQLVASLE